MKKRLFWTALATATSILLTLTGCGLGSDSEPTTLLVPKDIFPSEIVETNQDRLAPNATMHPVYFLRDDALMEIQRPLPPPVFLAVSDTHLTLPTIYSV